MAASSAVPRNLSTVLLGLDAFDPAIFEKLYGLGKLPYLGRMLELGGYARMEVANPPQSEVSWTSLASGLNPGQFGLFDFVHRHPQSYTPYPSLLTTSRRWYGVRFTAPHQAYSVFDFAVDQGFPATRLWWPATFPPDLGSPVRSISGLGTPDILGRLGAGVFLTPESPGPQSEYKTRLVLLDRVGQHHYRGQLPGPFKKAGFAQAPSHVDVDLQIIDEDLARVHVGQAGLDLRPGRWSPILELQFPMRFGLAVHALTRIVARLDEGIPSLYVLPLQIHPLHPVWPLTSPPAFGKRIWREHGRFLSLGWPQDTTGLEEGLLTESLFDELCDSVFEFRRRLFLDELDRFGDGILGAVFDSLDRVQHMHWRDRPERIAAWYQKYDSLVGEILSQLAGRPETRLLVISDHGFADFDVKVDVNRWLQQEGYLVASDGQQAGNLESVDWGRTKAYSLGLNSLYLNLKGREGQGSLDPAQKDSAGEELRRRLLDWKDASGHQVFSSVWLGSEAFSGSLVERGPDLVLGFNAGFRASAENGLGGWTSKALRANQDRWSGDHCIDPQWVPGVLFSSEPLWRNSAPGYGDIPEIAAGMRPTTDGRAPPPPKLTETDRQVLEDRLRDLGYL